MIKEEFKFKSTDGKNEIRALRFVPEGKVKGILQIAHGMVEFIDRYENFAQFLTDKGYLVTGNDHLGHGGSVKTQEDWGYFGDNGNRHVLDDMYELLKITKEIYPDTPYYLLGHSMGSFYARQFICEYGNELDGAIIMGTGHQGKGTVSAGKMMCKLIAKFKGWRYRSSFINNMAIGSYNKAIKDPVTDVDWLSKDVEICKKYLNEPRNTFTFTLNGYYYMFEGMERLYDTNLLNNIPKDLPLLFVSGKDDPVGNFGEGVKQAAKSVMDAGVKHVDLKLYEGDRHEILNELDKETVYEDLYRWLETKQI